MLSYDDALVRVLSHAAPLSALPVALHDALNGVLAGDVLAPISLPPFPNSQMDGYAVRFLDLANGQRTLPVAFTVQAGQRDVPPLPVGRAAKVMTGAMLPFGADTVVPHEDTDNGTDTVQIRDAGVAGQFVRPAGEDIRAGELALSSGSLLTPLRIGLLAALGFAHVSVHRAPVVAVISTGDELVQPGFPLLPGQIYNSNAYVLSAQVREAGGVARVHSLPVPDDLDALRRAFDDAAGADIVLTSGGVSVGEFDHVKAAWQERGTLDFWRVAIRPGRPLAFGTGQGALFFGLPGNPVSAAVTFELFVRPVILRMRGLRDVCRPLLTATLTAPASHEPGRRSFQRGVAVQNADGWTVAPLAGQGSHLLKAAAEANALLVLSETRAHWDAGERVPVIMLP